MKFRKGQRVRLTSEVVNKQGIIPAGATGRITDVFAKVHLYVIDFDSPHANFTGIKVHEIQLTATDLQQASLLMSQPKLRDKKR